MTKQDDANLNTNNPLRLRSAAYGGAPMLFQNMDDNFLNVMRIRGVWGAGTYLKNEVVWHQGFQFIAAADTTTKPGVAGSDWWPLTGLNGAGGMVMDSQNVPGSNIGLAYQTIDYFDTVDVGALGCTLDPVTGQFSFIYEGVWQLSIYFTFEHNSSNSGRLTNARLYNVTDAAASTGTIIATGRNAEATMLSSVSLLNIDSIVVGKQFRLEIGGYDTYTSVEWDALSLDLLQVAIAR